MKYYVIAGETSGDLHAGNLVKEISISDPQASVRGVGGEQLKAAGAAILFGLDRLAFMGFSEVLLNLGTIRRNFRDIKQDILSFSPEVVILVDYPGFNLRMAKWCKQNGFKVVYFISPQIWAWNEKRVDVIKRNVDLVLCILPFEKAFYEKHQYTNAHFIGHPLLDTVARHPEPGPGSKNSIALLPGSRKQEISKLIPVMLETAHDFRDEKFVIAGISRLKNLYPPELPPNVSIVFDQAYELLNVSKAALVCSGTATLEAALFNVPQVVLYKTSWLNYRIGKQLAKVKFISLPNLIADKEIVKELIQQDCTSQKVTEELRLLLSTAGRYGKQFYDQLLEKTGQQGASAKAAKRIIQFAGSRDVTAQGY